MKNKKGIQLNEAFGAVLALILVAILVIIGIYMFTSISVATVPAGSSRWGINETLTVSTDGTRMAGATVLGSTCGTITEVFNVTGSPINSGNYTQTNCVIQNLTKIHGGSWMVNYPYSSPTTTASRSTITNFSQYPALVGLVGTIIFLGIVIGVLVASFVFGGKNKA